MEGRSQYQRMRSARSRRRGGWPTFRFVKGGIPRAYPAWDLWILRMLARSCISVGTGEDEKEARRCMSPRLPTFAKNKGAKVGHPPKSAYCSGNPRLGRSVALNAHSFSAVVCT